MSDHSEPYANGFGILAGILILWVGTFALCVIFKSLFYGGPEAGGEDEAHVSVEAAAVGVAEPRHDVEKSLDVCFHAPCSQLASHQTPESG